MVIPIAARDLAAGAGALLIVTAAVSEIGTLIVPRPIGSWLTRLVDRLVNGTFRMITAPITDYRRRDRVLAAQAATILLAQLAAWLGIFFVGYALLLWPFVPDVTAAVPGRGHPDAEGRFPDRAQRPRAARPCSSATPAR